jgi:RHS repeat-associated protein
LSRDANQTARGVWGFIKYDALNRPVATGEISSFLQRIEWVTIVNAITNHHEDRANGTVAGYSLDNTAPTGATEADLLTITFYDDYSFTKATDLNYNAVSGYNASNNVKVKGQKTGGRAKMLLGNPATDPWRTNAIYYDGGYRQIQLARELHDLGSGAFERVSTSYKYDLAAVPDKQKTEQIISTGTNSHLAEYSYDHADRLLGVKETIAFGSLTKYAYTVAPRYNILGQLQSKWIHANRVKPTDLLSNTKFRHKTDYVSNIRGWLNSGITWYSKNQGIDSTFHGFSLAYDNGSNYTNGNISKMLLRGKRETTFVNGLSFTYDGANRLKNSSTIGTYADTESGITYDTNGKILSLSRAGAAVDNLTYSYPNLNNQLGSINARSGNDRGIKNGASGMYAYDNNGNMTTNGNRNATLTYNYLNLPEQLNVNSKTLIYDYDAAGVKHKYTIGSTSVKYAGAFEYDENNVLTKVATTEGLVRKITTATPALDSLRFDYFLKDHLGNIRIVWDENGKILQETGFYPFGLSIDRNNPVQTPVARSITNRYLYIGKELQDETGFVDYGARMYIPETGRSGVVYPLSEKMPSWSPYSYGFNNPIRFVDPSGMAPDVRLEGKEAQEAFKQLQASVQKDLTLSMDNTGKLSYTQNGDGKLSKSAEQLTNAINDNSIVVNVNAENTTIKKSGNLYIGGAFSGNTVTKGADGNSVVAEQEVNPTVLGAMSTAHGKPGADILHEVTEPYQGGLISQKNGMSSPVSNQPGSVYQKVHGRATNQSGQVFERIYDSSGRELQMTPTGYPVGVKSADWYVNDKSGNKVIIQTII